MNGNSFIADHVALGDREIIDLVVSIHPSVGGESFACKVEFPLVDTPPMWTLLLIGHFLPGPFIFPI